MIQRLYEESQGGGAIRVFLMGTDQKLAGKEAWGLAARINPNAEPGQQGETNACWIVADPVGGRQLGELPRTIAHEIGHVMLGNGHPNEGEGDAVLKWDDGVLPRISKDPRDRARLMCSGPGADLSDPGSQLITKEWVKIEAWLKAHVDSPTL